MVATEKPRTTSNDLLFTLTEHIEALAQATDKAILSEQMQRYLEMCAQFHHYSSGNVWLILLSCPHATMVAGFQKWKSMGRYVCKGQKGIPILAPLLVRKENENGEKEKVLTGFKVVYVFDVSQTEGESLPETPDWKSPEKNADLSNALITFAEGMGIQVEVKEHVGETQGVSYGGRIALSPQAGTKTLIHELAHEMLHQQGDVPRSSTITELEAEGVAFVVAKYFGLDQLASPNYLALWGLGGEEILAHLDRVTETAKEIIQGVEMVC